MSSTTAFRMLCASDNLENFGICFAVNRKWRAHIAHGSLPHRATHTHTYVSFIFANEQFKKKNNLQSIHRSWVCVCVHVTSRAASAAECWELMPKKKQICFFPLLSFVGFSLPGRNRTEVQANRKLNGKKIQILFNIDENVILCILHRSNMSRTPPLPLHPHTDCPFSPMPWINLCAKIYIWEIFLPYLPNFRILSDKLFSYANATRKKFRRVLIEPAQIQIRRHTYIHTMLINSPANLEMHTAISMCYLESTTRQNKNKKIHTKLPTRRQTWPDWILSHSVMSAVGWAW